ncbi:hypothetical protein UlMin_027418 [Ulmus minor]
MEEPRLASVSAWLLLSLGIWVILNSSKVDYKEREMKRESAATRPAKRCCIGILQDKGHDLVTEDPPFGDEERLTRWISSSSHLISVQARAKASSIVKIATCEHSLSVGHDVILGISHAVSHLWVLVEWRRLRISLMKVMGTVGDMVRRKKGANSQRKGRHSPAKPKSIAPSLLEAINDLATAIIVLSLRYANSRFYWKGFIYFIRFYHFYHFHYCLVAFKKYKISFITPAHDLNDFEVGKWHNLEFINVFIDDGKINSNEANNNEMCLGIFSRSNDVVEPLIKPQWYVNGSSMAKEGLDAMTDDKNGKIQIIPKQYLTDWKRQLQWGHQVPAWYVILEDDDLKEIGAYNDHWVVARNKEKALVRISKASWIYTGKNLKLEQDPNVLDTWFSSCLFPLFAFYPTSILKTGHDILFFWVAHMVMLEIKLGGNVPFGKVYLHPMIRDAHGRKMSKSLGNVVDLLEVIINGISLEGLHKRLEEGQKKDLSNGIDECGADALCFVLVSYTTQWCNKLWNAIRFSISKLGDDYVPSSNVIPPVLPFSCQWILSILNKAIEDTNQFLEDYLCDVFIEVIKPYFVGNDPKFASERSFAQDTLWLCLDYGMRLLHPFMPFVTEELWQRLPYVRASFYFRLKFKSLMVFHWFLSKFPMHVHVVASYFSILINVYLLINLGYKNYNIIPNTRYRTLYYNCFS